MVNQAFRIKIAYRSKEKEKEKKIPGIGRYPMGPTINAYHRIHFSGQINVALSCSDM